MREPDGSGPERMCIATRQSLPVGELIRFVAAPDGAITPDLKRKLPGRGVWVLARADAVADAVKRKAFAKSLKAPVTASPALSEEVGALLERAALQALAMANKAGAVVFGAAKIEGGTKRGYAALIHASDASEAGVEKLERPVRKASRDGGSIASIRLFSAEQLSLSLGREHVIHAALVAGAPAGNFLAVVAAAERYRRKTPAPALAPGLTAPEGVGVCISTKDPDPDE